MADNKRGGRSSDDEFDDNDELADDAGLDDLLDEIDDDEDGDVATAKRSPATAGARSRAGARTKTSVKEVNSRGPIGRLVGFVREVVAELQKVIWPTRKELLTYTSVVVVFVAVIMTMVSLLDLGFAKLMFLVFGSQTTT